MLELGPLRFDPLIVGLVALTGALAVATVYGLRDVLATAPAAAFPLLMTVLIGGLLLIRWVAGRRRG